jgi:hypothetical protein
MRPFKNFVKKAAEAREQYLLSARRMGWDAADRSVACDGEESLAARIRKISEIVRDDWDRNYLQGYRERGERKPRPT